MLRSLQPWAIDAEHPAESVRSRIGCARCGVVAAPVCGERVGELADRAVEHFEMMRRRYVVRGGVAGPRLGPQRLPVAGRAQHRTKPVAALVMGRRAGFVLRVDLHQRGIDVEHQRPFPIRDPTRPRAGAHGRCGVPHPVEPGVVDARQRAIRRRLRRDLTEQRRLGAQMLDIAARVPAAGEHQRHLGQHRAPVMNRRSLAAVPYRRRQLIAQPQRVRETPQNEQPAIRRDLPPAAFETHIFHTASVHLGDALLFCTMRAVTTRIVAGQKGLSADAHTHNHNPDEKSGLGEWIAGQSVMELFHRGQAQRLAFAPVNTVAQMSEDPHLAAREFLVTYDQPGLGRITVPGAPSRLSNPWWSIRSPAPALGEHAGAAFETSSACAASAAPTQPGGDRPLDGVTVADFTWVWAGPFCTLHLAHLGATVIKIESTARPDLGRRLPTYSIHHDETLDTNGYFNQYGQGKRSITIDMGTAEGRELAKRLAVSCDLVVSNYATGVMDGFGLGYEALAEQRPDVIVAAISGYGQNGPYKSYMGYGPTTGPLSGLASLTGYPGGGAEELGVSLGDPAAGIATAYALVAALVARRRTGEGQFIDTSMWEATTACIAEGWMETVLTGEQPEPMGNWDPLMSPHNMYRCSGDDDWVAVCCADDGEWEALAGEIGLDPADVRFATAADRKANEVGLDRIIAAWTSARDQWSVTEQLQAVGVPAYPSLSPRSIEANPHLLARGLIERLDHPAVGQMSHIGIPWLLHDGTNGVRSPAPTLGQHTHEVLTDVLGLSPAEIASLSEADILR